MKTTHDAAWILPVAFLPLLIYAEIMTTDSSDNREEIIDALMDLKHDLGKYILLPLSMLPIDASQKNLHDSLRMALLETRKAPNETLSARKIWTRFCQMDGPLVSPMEEFTSLQEKVEDFLNMENLLETNAPLDREHLIAAARTINQQILSMIQSLDKTT